MVASLIRAALSQRLVVVVLALVLCAFGVREATRLSVDAFPDVTNVQVQVATEAPGRSPEEIERFVTVPLEIAMTGLPGLVEMRSLNKSGLSIITLVFTDTTDVYFARQLVTERLIEVTPRMPAGIVPVLGPVSTGLGEVYQYTLERPDDGQRALTPEELAERRTVQDWVLRPMLRSIPGVAEINSQGGYVKQYQALVDPGRLRHYGLSVQQVVQAIANNNANASGGILPQLTEQYLIRGLGLIRTMDDIANIVVKEQAGVPVFVRDVATVQLGGEVRQGAIIKGGYTEGVSGIVLMMRGGNAKQVVSRVKDRVDEINRQGLLPDGLQIVPYYDRTELVDSALFTVGKVLVEGIFLVVVVLFIFLGDVRSSLIVVATLVITPLTTFILMNRYGISANLMSLGGLAIAIGLMVDATVVVVENVYHRVGHAHRLRHGHHHPGVPAADDAAGHRGQDVRAAGADHCHGPGRIAGGVADPVAGAVRLLPQGRGRPRHPADRLPEAPLPAPAGRRHAAQPPHAGGGRGPAAGLAGPVSAAGQILHAHHEGRRADTADQPRAQHLAGRIHPHGNGRHESRGRGARCAHGGVQAGPGRVARRPGRAQRVRPHRAAGPEIGPDPGRDRRGHPPTPVQHPGRADRAVAADLRAGGRDGDRGALAAGHQGVRRRAG